jgi:hypothetical protein
VSRPNRRRVLKLAAASLTSARAGDWDRATRLTERIYDECGSAGVLLALRGWVDTLIVHMGHVPGTPIAIAFQDTESGAITTADDPDVRPEVVWAGRLIAARAALDEETWDALLLAIPRDEQGRYIPALLEIVALMTQRKAAAS